MTTVRKTAQTTVTLIILAVGVTLLMRWCGTLSGEFFYKMEALLNSKAQIGGFHGFLIPFSFRLLLIASGIEAVYCEKNGVYALGSFVVPIIFSLCVAGWGLVATFTRVNILWFWLFCYVGLIICVRVSYSRLSNIKGAGPSKIKMLLKSPPSKNDGDVSIIDRSVLYVAKIVMLIDWFVLLIAAIVFCIQTTVIKDETTVSFYIGGEMTTAAEEHTTVPSDLVKSNPLAFFEKNPDLKINRYFRVVQLGGDTCLHVRNTYSKKGKIIGRLYSGNRVYVYGNYKGWMYLYSESAGYGWSYSQYLTAESDAAAPASSTAGTGYTYAVKGVGKAGLYLRSGAGKNFKPIALLREKSLVTVYRIDKNGWAYVRDRASGLTGWCFSRYLQPK